jgi:hypothetical protein
LANVPAMRAKRILLVLEAHRVLHFRDRVDEGAQWIAGQRMKKTSVYRSRSF